MTGQAEKIRRTDKTLEERGLPGDSFFAVTFADGSSVDERDANWSDMAEERRVGYFGGTKTVFACRFPVSRIAVSHGDLEASMDVPRGCEAYQAVRSETVLQHGSRKDTVVGRAIGVIRDGEVVEEKVVNEVEHAVSGMRK